MPTVAPAGRASIRRLLVRLAVTTTAIAGLAAGLVASPAAAAPGAPAQRPSLCRHDAGHADRNSYLCAEAGDIVDVRIGDLHATQPSLGRDEVYYKLGRYTLGKDVINKKFDDWCEASGLVEASWAAPDARLDDPTSFGCKLQPGQETAASRSLMKTVVIGPQGSLWLTDGHHTLTAFFETPDGGPDTHVRLLVAGNLSRLPTSRFRAAMIANKWVWLQDSNGRSIRFNDLPGGVGLGNFADDKYRSLLYFARDIGYASDTGIPFAEFWWGTWLRTAHPELTTWDSTTLTGYLAAVRAVSQAQVALPAGAVVAGGFTREQLGTFASWNDGKAETKGEWAKLVRPYSDAKPGKIAYALAYKEAHGLV